MTNDFPWLAHYDESVPASIDYPNTTLQHFLKIAAENNPDKACTIFHGARMSYQQAEDDSDKLAAGLASIGVQKGSRIGLLMPNCPQFILAYFAILKLGAIVVTFDPLLNSKEIIRQANDADVELIFLLSNLYAKVKALQPQTKIKIIIASNIKDALPPVSAFIFGLLRESKEGHLVDLNNQDLWMQELSEKFSPRDKPQVPISGDDPATIQYSRGITGQPKGVISLHRNLVANLCQFNAWMTNLYPSKEVIILAIPMHHIHGMVAGLGYGIFSGNTIVPVPNPQDHDNIVKQIEKCKVTFFPGEPEMFNAISTHPAALAGKDKLRTIKVCLSTSAPLERETIEALKTHSVGFILEGYGLSEAVALTHINPLQGPNKNGSIGIPLPDVEVRIVDRDDGLVVLPQGEIGELVIKGPQVMHAYHKLPTETYNSLREGWLYTGDIAYMDEDGYFYIVGRKKAIV